MAEKIGEVQDLQKPITYTASYQAAGSKAKSIPNVVADGYVADETGMMAVRWLQLLDGRRVELAMSGNAVLFFSADRIKSINQREAVKAAKPTPPPAPPTGPEGETLQ